MDDDIFFRKGSFEEITNISNAIMFRNLELIEFETKFETHFQNMSGTVLNCTVPYPTNTVAMK